MTLAPTPSIGSLRLGEILVDMGVVSPESVESALELQQEKGSRIGDLLVDMEAITEDDVAKALAQQLDLDYDDELEPDEIDPQLVSRMSLSYVRSNEMLPLVADETVVRLAVVDPLNTFAIDDIRVLLNREVELVVVARATLSAAMLLVEASRSRPW